MKTKILPWIISLTLLGALGTSSAQSKEEVVAQGAEPQPFDKKFRWGLSWNQYWGNVKGNALPEEYFGKPCLGFNILAQYYPLSFVGMSVGAGIQQRGAGIINPDNSGGSFTHPWEYPQFDADSTYRQRLRFTTYEIPVTLLLRTPKDVIKGMRLSGAAGISYIKTKKVSDFFMSVEDGYHTDIPVTKDYLTNDLAYQLSLGTDIDAGGSGLLQVHLVYTKGTKNMFAVGQGSGHLETYGFRVSWLY
ncbi:MAG: hypothetical protein JNJ65_07995 [Cyclobacteriaceae bacterium]|nr:hypothetical protein [Cyclobacteriaceae bacterium]